jgi:hypothetical protein
MAIAVEKIEVGKCYLDDAGELRRVLTSGGSKITYDSGGKKVPPGQIWGPRVTMSAEQFADHVEREVSCDELCRKPGDDGMK